MTVLLLLSLLFRASVVIAVSLLIARMLRRRSADVRADLWRATFVALALLPLATVCLPALPWLPALASEAAPPSPSTIAVPPSVLPDLLVLGDDGQSATIDPTAAAAGPERALAAQVGVAVDPAAAVPTLRLDWIDSLILLWIAGVIVQAVRLVLALRCAAVMARDASPADANGGVRVVHSPDAMSPFVWDARPFARPVVVLPLSNSPFSNGDDPAWRDAVLAHEFHHVERRDGAFLPFATLIAALYWPTPFVRVALRRLRLELERAADDAAVRAGVRPSDYAQGLVALASSTTALPVPTMTAAGTVVRRVEALLEAGLDRRSNSRRARYGALIATLAVCLPIATVTAATADQEGERQAKTPTQDAVGNDPITEEVRLAMRERALDALVAMQDEKTGAWLGDVGYKLNNGWHVTAKNVAHVGVTGLAVEALIEGGTRFDESLRGRSLKRALDFLLECQDSDGYIHANGSRMRSHAHAMRGLATVLRFDPQPWLDDAAERAMEFSLRAQDPVTGGWRFIPSEKTSNIIETAYQSNALEYIGNARLQVAMNRGPFETGPGRMRIYVPAAARRYAKRLRIAEANDRRFGGFRFELTATSRITLNTDAAGLMLLFWRGRTVIEDIDLATAERIRAGRTELAAGLVDPERHFLTWDALLLVERALDHLDGWTLSATDLSVFNSTTGKTATMSAFHWDMTGSSEPLGVPWRAETLCWLARLQLPSGGWQCTTGIGDAYATAVGCVLLSDDRSGD